MKTVHNLMDWLRNHQDGSAVFQPWKRQQISILHSMVYAHTKDAYKYLADNNNNVRLFN